MKMTLACILVVAVASLGKAEEHEWGIIAQSGFSSAYLGKPGILFYDGPVWMNELKVKRNDLSLYAGFWSSTALGDDPSLGDFGDEINLYAGWERNVSDWLKLDVRFVHLALADLGRLDDDRYAVDLRADFISFKWATPYVAARYFGRLSDKISEGGWFVWAGIKRSQPLFKISSCEKPVTLTADLQAAYSDGALGREAGVIYSRAMLSLDVPLTKSTSIVSSIMHQLPSGDQTGRRGDYADGDETVWNIGLKFVF